MRNPGSGRKPLFTPEQVRQWREEYRYRLMVLRTTRSCHQLARDAGVVESTMRQLLSGFTYKGVR